MAHVRDVEAAMAPDAPGLDESIFTSASNEADQAVRTSARCRFSQ